MTVDLRYGSVGRIHQIDALHGIGAGALGDDGLGFAVGPLGHSSGLAEPTLLLPRCEDFCEEALVFSSMCLEEYRGVLIGSKEVFDRTDHGFGGFPSFLIERLEIGEGPIDCEPVFETTGRQ